MKISVVDANGDPVAGVKLEVIDPGTQEVVVDLRVMDQRREDVLEASDRRTSSY